MGIFTTLFGSGGKESNSAIDQLADDISYNAERLQSGLSCEGLPGIIDSTLDMEATNLCSSVYEFEKERGRQLSSWELARLMTKFVQCLRAKGLAPHHASRLKQKVRNKVMSR